MKRLKAWTIDDIENVDAILASLDDLSVPEIWLRVVFDLENEPEYYYDALARLKALRKGPDVKIMGQFLDSSDFSRITPAQYRKRVKRYCNALHGLIDMGECGNEVNGNWLGTSLTVKNKVVAAIEECRVRKIPSAVTWYITPNLLELYRWMRRYPLDPDYAFLSWYPYTEGWPKWEKLFHDFRELLPRPVPIGIGEYGVEGIPEKNPQKILNAKISLVRTVESLPAVFPDTIGFGGYWDAYQDVCLSRKLLPVFKELWT